MSLFDYWMEKVAFKGPAWQKKYRDLLAEAAKKKRDSKIIGGSLDAARTNLKRKLRYAKNTINELQDDRDNIAATTKQLRKGRRQGANDPKEQQNLKTYLKDKEESKKYFKKQVNDTYPIIFDD